MGQEYLPKVREQYENYPYPYRNPEDEKIRILETEHTVLEKINCYCHQGKENFQNYYALMAGCGTGDAVIDLGLKLRNTDSKIVALDISEASLNIAKARADIHKLKNIEWIHGSLLNLPEMKLGKFDYINSCGVLHHLADPDAGLKALKSVLKDEGCMTLMLYAEYGRTGVYQIQELMRLINKDEENLQNQVDSTKLILNELPATNWFKRAEEYFSDIKNFADIGIYDLFLHSQDRAYTIPQLYEFLRKADLHLVEFATPSNRILLQPSNFIKDPVLLEKISHYDKPTQQAITELLVGILGKHSFFASALSNSRATTDNLDNIPFLHGFPEAGVHLKIAEAIAENEKNFTDTSKPKMKITKQNIFITFDISPYTKYYFKHINGDNDLRTIFHKVKSELADFQISNEILIKDFTRIYELFENCDSMFLKHKASCGEKPVF